MLGILVLDTTFPRIPGDVGAPSTFAFPVRHRVVAAASVQRVVHGRDDALLPDFVEAGTALAQEGCTGIATTCGFLARWQDELANRLPVPVLTSVLVLVPAIARMIARDRRVGIVTYSAAELDAGTLAALGIDPATPVEGVDPAGYFARTIREGRRTLEPTRMRDDTVQAARRLVAAHPEVAAIVLECANMPPYRDDVAAAVERPVFDAAGLLRWFHASLAARAGAPRRRAG